MDAKLSSIGGPETAVEARRQARVRAAEDTRQSEKPGGWEECPGELEPRESARVWRMDAKKQLQGKL